MGSLLEKVSCEADATQTYALYIPSNYVPGKKWPAIFCFDAGGRGKIPVERLQAAAEKYGYIVAGSLTSRNGPWTANATAAQAMIKDVTSHLSVDAKRLYTTGVSGGARVATSLALSGAAKGVIACSGGFPTLPEGLPGQLPFAFFGTAGTEDFNHAELARLDGDLEDRKAVHRIVFFNGGHEWASAALMTEAVEWFELQAMKAGTHDKDDAFIQTMWQTRVAALPAQPVLERFRALKSLVADFTGLTNVDDFSREMKTLAASRDVKEQLKLERTLTAREEGFLDSLSDAADGGSLSEKKKLATKVRQLADAPQDTAERQMARRVVGSFVYLARVTAGDFFEEKQYYQAIGYLELSTLLKPEQPRTLFDLSRAYAGDGNKKRVVETLAQAVAAGFKDADRVESEPLFAKIRGDTEFQKIQAKMHESDPIVQLPAMRVSAGLANVELRLFYLPNAGPDSTKPLSFLRVETVRRDSFAARAGLAEGMEIVAIQGTRIRGLTDAELNELMKRPVKDEIVFVARKYSNGPETEVRLALPRKPTTASEAEKK